MLFSAASIHSIAMFSASTQDIYSRSSPTVADRVVRNRVQHEHVLQTWYFLGSVLAFFTLVNVVRKTWALIAPLPKISKATASGKADEEKHVAPKVTRSAFQRVLSTISTTFRIVFFRWSIPIGPGSIASMSELTFILIYIAANLVWLFVDSKLVLSHDHNDLAQHCSQLET